MTSRLQQALHEGLAQGCLDERLRDLGDYVIETQEDAGAICDAIRRLPCPGSARRGCGGSPLAAVLCLFDCVCDEDSPAAQVLHRQGVPELIQLLSRLDERCESDVWDWMLTLKVLATYGTRAGARQVVQAARKPLDEESFLWSTVLGQFTSDHPQTPFIFDCLSRTLPVGYIAVALLDAANAAAIDGAELRHPFNTPLGRRRLHHWLTNPDPDQYSYALSATAALPFIDNPERDQLLALAFEHADAGVQLEAAWASAKLGSEAGLKCLARYCLERDHSVTAQRYLEELQRADMIPPAARESNFQALAAMCDWLAGPNEFGRPPDCIELWDQRELIWPPVHGPRHLWLFRYHYCETRDEEAITGVGMAGSITWSFGEQHDDDLTPNDYYALHCCWELELNEDPRAPQKRCIEAGHRLLRQANADW